MSSVEALVSSPIEEGAPSTPTTASPTSSLPHGPDDAPASLKRSISQRSIREQSTHGVQPGPILAPQQPLNSARQRKVTMPQSPTTEIDSSHPRRLSSVRRSNTHASTNPSLLRRVTSLIQPAKKLGEDPTIKASLLACVKASWLNVLLVFIPVSWALHFALDHSKSSSDTVIFVTSFLAIIPLAKLLAFGTEELAIRVGQTLGGLLNATLGNVVELIVGIIALAQCKLRVVQSSLVGSILSNLLLVLGMCFFAGGTRFSEQGFMQTTAQLNTSLLILSVTAILIPAAFSIAVNSQNLESSTDQHSDVLQMSHGVAIILLWIYGSYLVFQLWSHAHLFDEHGETAAAKSTKYPAKTVAADEKDKKPGFSQKFFRYKSDKKAEDVEARPNLAATSLSRENTVAPTTVPAPISNVGEEDEDEEIPQLTVWVAVGLLVIVTVLVAVTAEFLVSSIDGLTQSGNISEEWVGLILLPIVGNAAEHVTAVTVSVKDKLDLSIGVAVGSSIQIALFVIPLLVILGWIMGKPLTLLFDPLESVVLFLGVLTVAFIINDGRSNWLEGNILMTLYIIIATAFWFYEPSTDASC